MADTNTSSSTIPEWFIAAMVVVIGIIILELVTIAALVIFIIRNWRHKKQMLHAALTGQGVVKLRTVESNDGYITAQHLTTEITS